MIRFYNGRVLTFEPEAKIRQCEVWTDGARICHVGARPEAVPEFEREIDLCSFRALRMQTRTRA